MKLNTNFSEILSIIIMLLILSLILFSCNTRHCLKFGGEYQGIQGDLEYCIDFLKTEEIGLPIIRDSDGIESVILNEQQVEILLGEEVKAQMFLKDKKQIWEKLNERIQK